MTGHRNTPPDEPRDHDGLTVTAERILDYCLNADPNTDRYYDAGLVGWVFWEDGKLQFVSDISGEPGDRPLFEWDLPCPDGPPRLTGRSW